MILVTFLFIYILFYNYLHYNLECNLFLSKTEILSPAPIILEQIIKTGEILKKKLEKVTRE